MRNGEEGYSLIELLIVLALLSLIAMLISGGMRFGARAWEVTENEVAIGESVRGGQTVLRDLLSRLDPLESEASDPNTPPSFVGERDRMEFRSLAPSGGVARVALAVERLGNAPDLLLHISP